MSKKIKVKVNPLLLDKSTVRDTVSNVVFNHNDWVEVDMDIWERLKDAKYKQGKTKVSVLIADEEELDDHDGGVQTQKKFERLPWLNDGSRTKNSLSSQT